jgi:hypothetical protein
MRVSASIIAALGSALALSTLALAADTESLPGGEAATPATAQQCLKDLAAFDEELAEVGFGVLPPGGFAPSEPSAGYYVWGVEGTPRQKMRALRDAAYVYAWGGNEQSCQSVLASMTAVYEQHQKLVGSEADNPNMSTAWRRAHLSRARPATEIDHLMRPDILIGSEIRNPEDDWLGTIDDAVLSPGARDIVYLLFARGGFLGFGRTLVAIRWSDLRATDDHEIYVLNAREHPFFAGFEEAFCKLVCGCARNVRFESGQYLFREGEPANEFYLLRHGRVALEIAPPGRSAVTFQTVGEGEIVGVSWLIPPYRWTYDARALDLVRAIGMDATCLRQKCEADHDLGYEMMKRFMPVLIQRLQATRLQIVDVYGSSA